MGNVIPYRHKERLKDSEEVVSLYSYNFPPMVEAREEEFVIPHDELWYSEEKRLFCYIGKYPETEYIPKSAYKQAEDVAHFARALRAFKKLSGLDMGETAEIEEMFEKSAEAVEERIQEQIEKAAYKGEGVGAEPS